MRKPKTLRIDPVASLYTVKEVAGFMRVCEKTIRNEIDANKLGHAMVRGSLRIPESEYRAYVERQTVRSNIHGA